MATYLNDEALQLVVPTLKSVMTIVEVHYQHQSKVLRSVALALW
jgi:hypothetical protein